MARIMYDSTNPFDIPLGAPMVAGYVDGAYAWPDAGWQRFARKPQVLITVGSGTLDADVADVERYDYTPATGAAWLKRKIARDGYGSLYFSRGLFGTVAAAVHALGISDSQWGVWVADWTGSSHNLPGALATQYADSAMVGAHYDLSLAGDYWPGVDALPAPPPTQGAGAALSGWAGLQEVLGTELPAFASGLGVLASGIESLG